MNILFILNSMSIGGLQTYYNRLAKYLNSSDVKIHLLIVSRDSTQDNILIQNYSKVYYIDEYRTKFNKLFNIHSSLNHIICYDENKIVNDFAHIDYIHCGDSFSLVIANGLSKYISNLKISTGIYQSEEFLWENTFYFRKIQKNIFKNLADENILFANQASLDYYTLKAQIALRGVIVPFGIDLELYNTNNHTPQDNPKKIISINRLDRFKTYVKHTIDTVIKLNKAGYNLEYHIYGEGDEKYFSSNINENDLKNIFFHGHLDYSKLADIFKDTFLFVGGGTIIIEASASGVPSVIGIESASTPDTYGLFSDLKIDSFNRNDLPIKKLDIEKVILEVLNISKDEYCVLSKKHILKSNEFNIKNTSILFKDAMSNLQNTKSVNYIKIRYILSYITWLVLDKLNVISSRKNMHVKK